MPRVIVLPAAEDQGHFLAGRIPANHFDHTFGTAEEVERYVEGVEAMHDLADYEVLEETGLTMLVSLDAEETTLTFATQAEKDAYGEGLEDGNGFFRARCVSEDDPDFPALAAMFDEAVPVPAPR